MKTSEAAKLLAIISSFDHRKVSEEDAANWAGLLAELELNNCVEAVRAHFRESGEYLLPAHVVIRVQAEMAHRAAVKHQALPECAECGQPYGRNRVVRPGDYCWTCEQPLRLRVPVTGRCEGGGACENRAQPCLPGHGVLHTTYVWWSGPPVDVQPQML